MQKPTHFGHRQFVGCCKVPGAGHDAVVGLPPEVGEVLMVVTVQVLDVVSQVFGGGKVFDVEVRVRRGHLVVSATESKRMLPNNSCLVMLVETYSSRTIGTTFQVNARQNFSLMYWSHIEFSRSAVATPNRLVWESGAPDNFDSFRRHRGQSGRYLRLFDGQGLLEQPPGT